jgi:hypothetical protein
MDVHALVAMETPGELMQAIASHLHAGSLDAFATLLQQIKQLPSVCFVTSRPMEHIRSLVGYTHCTTLLSTPQDVQETELTEAMSLLEPTHMLEILSTYCQSKRVRIWFMYKCV